MSKRVEPFIVSPAPEVVIVEPEETTRKVKAIARDSKNLWHYLETQMQQRTIGWYDAASCFRDSVAQRIDALEKLGALKYPNHENGFEHKTLSKYYPRICALSPSNLQDLYRDADRELELIINSATVTGLEYRARRMALLFLRQWVKELLLF